jgi:hypothetical protein
MKESYSERRSIKKINFPTLEMLIYDDLFVLL